MQILGRAARPGWGAARSPHHDDWAMREDTMETKLEKHEAKHSALARLHDAFDRHV
jgi:hypothetical protein